MIGLCLCVCTCTCRMNTQADEDRLQKLERRTHKHTKEEHALSCVLSVLCQVRRLSLLFNSAEEGELDALCTRRGTHTHTRLPTSFPDTLSQRQKDGKKKNQF